METLKCKDTHTKLLLEEKRLKTANVVSRMSGGEELAKIRDHPDRFFFE